MNKSEKNQKFVFLRFFVGIYMFYRLIDVWIASLLEDIRFFLICQIRRVCFEQCLGSEDFGFLDPDPDPRGKISTKNCNKKKFTLETQVLTIEKSEIIKIS